MTFGPDGVSALARYRAQATFRHGNKLNTRRHVVA